MSEELAEEIWVGCDPSQGVLLHQGWFFPLFPWLDDVAALFPSGINLFVPKSARLPLLHKLCCFLPFPDFICVHHSTPPFLGLEKYFASVLLYLGCVEASSSSPLIFLTTCNLPHLFEEIVFH